MGFNSAFKGLNNLYSQSAEVITNIFQLLLSNFNQMISSACLDRTSPGTGLSSLGDQSQDHNEQNLSAKNI
jgi:hypothetical protein